MVKLFKEIKRVLKVDGTVWLNLGDTYYNYHGATDYSTAQKIASNDGHKMNRACGKRNVKQDNLKNKDLVGIPWRVAFALQADGWYLRQDIIWHKPNPMPESVKDRCTKSHEYIFLLTKSARYFFDNDAIAEKATGFDGRKDTYFKGGNKYKGHNHQTMLSRGHERWRYKNLKEKGQPTHSMHEKRLYGEEYLSPIRNKRSVWTVPTSGFKGAHFAVYPPALIVDCIKAGCRPGGIVLDPFSGAGTTAYVARKLGRKYIGIELNPEYIEITKRRLQQMELPLMAKET